MLARPSPAQHRDSQKGMWNVEQLPGKGSAGGHLQHIRFGPGVVGRTTTAVVAFMALLLAAVWVVENPWLIAGFVLVGFLVLAGFVYKAFDYAEKHPDHAVTEGGELVRKPHKRDRH